MQEDAPLNLVGLLLDTSLCASTKIVIEPSVIYYLPGNVEGQQLMPGTVQGILEIYIIMFYQK